MSFDTHYALCLSEQARSNDKDYPCHECNGDSDCFASTGGDNGVPLEWICEACCEKDARTPVTIWSRSKLNPYWLVERTYPGKYAIEVLGLPGLAGETIVGDDNRLYAWFPVDTSPNKESI